MALDSFSPFPNLQRQLWLSLGDPAISLHEAQKPAGHTAPTHTPGSAHASSNGSVSMDSQQGLQADPDANL